MVCNSRRLNAQSELIAWSACVGMPEHNRLPNILFNPSYPSIANSTSDQNYVLPAFCFRISTSDLFWGISKHYPKWIASS